MRRTAVLLLGALLAVAGVVALQRLNVDRQYRGLLADGDTAMAAGQPYLAVEAFSGALAIRTDSMVAHYRRGEAYAALGQALQAERDLREARRLAPDAPEPLEALGRLHDRRADYAVAAGWYTQAAARLHETDARLLYALALARYRSGALPAAHDAVRRALAIDGTLAEAHYLLGLVAHDLQNRTEAIAALEQALRLRPGLVAARQELAGLYGEEGRVDDEAAQLRALVAHDGQLDRHLALARGQLRAGRHAAALDTLATAEAVVPGDSRVALAVGRVHLSLAEEHRDPSSIAAALAALERALGGTARRSEGLALYGRALHLAGDADGAERLLTDAIRTSPVAPAAFGYLADAAEALGHHLVARDALLSLDALEGNTATTEVRRTRARRIGALSLDGQDTSAAVQYLTLAHEAGDHTPDTLVLLVRALWADGRHDDARATLAAAVEQAGDDLALRRLERTLR
jgi:tetratricopeptide (TPR) repeat protein